mmetsp:Transcript_30770/g.77533  ORF Transcript_30770/g.77533 Transcript_30770/m.77533 type:complete len:400 (-) Transcript_30770:95-1294(-)
MVCSVAARRISLLITLHFASNVAAFVPPASSLLRKPPSGGLSTRALCTARRKSGAITCVIKDIESWEAEFSKLKPPAAASAARDKTDLFGGFGDMVKGMMGGSDEQTIQASRETEDVRNGLDAGIPLLDGHAIEAEYPHVPESFTQGLWWCEEEQKMYEGSGGTDFSHGTRLTRYDLETGEVEMGRQLPSKFFGEGIVGLGDKIFQLTWRTKVGFVYDRESMELIGQWKYDYEGWGMTTDGKSLIVSDGTATLHFLDPETLQETRTLVVRSKGFKSGQMAPLRRLNDLQWVKGDIYANIWESDRIAVIDPDTGVVWRMIECKGLVDESHPWIQKFSKSDRCLNGLAYDAKRDRLFVTGKLWINIYEIKELPGMGDQMKERQANPYGGGGGGGFDPLGLM